MKLFASILLVLALNGYQANAQRNERVVNFELVPYDGIPFLNSLDGTTLYITVKDTSRRDTSGVTLAERNVRNGRNSRFPQRFRLRFPVDLLNSRRANDITISARIVRTDDDSLLYTTDRVFQLSSVGNLDSVEMPLSKVEIQGYAAPSLDILKVTDGASDQTVNEICRLPPVTGKCRAYVPSYYFDPETQSCKFFVYGGCLGNQNRFKRERECLKYCLPNKKLEGRDPVCSLPKDTGFCRASLKRYYFDNETNRCVEFIFGGCGGNKNKFFTDAECYEVCSLDS